VFEPEGGEQLYEIEVFGSYNLLYAAGGGSYEGIEKVKKEPIEKVMYYLRRVTLEQRGQRRINKKKR